MHKRPKTDIRQWQVKSGAQPTVRVGIVLEEDAFDSLEILVNRPDFEIVATDGSRQAALAGTIQFHKAAGDSAVELRLPDSGGGVATVWRIEPTAEPPLAQGVGLCVRGVVAGRGFHWRKLIDQTLPGAVEIHPAAGGLVVINELPLEAYLAGVITSEMGGACPPDLLKAQGVVARSWLLAMTEAKHDADPFDRCNDDCCQRYQGTGDLSDAALSAVRDTCGLVLLDSAGEVVDANYSKSCGGISEPPETVWGITKPGLTVVADAPADSTVHRFLPITEELLAEYLDGDWWRGAEVYCSPEVVPEEAFGKYLGRVDEAGSYFRWDVSYARTELEDLLRAKLPELADMAQLTDLRVTERGPSGRAVRVAADWLDRTGKTHTAELHREYHIRAALHAKFLYSSAVAIRLERDNAGTIEKIHLRGAGWGHGAGLCQIGALGMALRGKTCEEICHHYFPTATLKQVY